MNTSIEILPSLLPFFIIFYPCLVACNHWDIKKKPRIKIESSRFFWVPHVTVNFVFPKNIIDFCFFVCFLFLFFFGASFNKNQFPVWYPLNQFIYDSGPTKICLIDSSSFSLRVFETMSIVSSPKTSVINNIPSLSSQPKTFIYNYGYPFLFLYFFCIP